METVNMTIRMDRELKKQAEELFADLGINMTAAINIFLRQAVREQRIPFNVSRDASNKETPVKNNQVRRPKSNTGPGSDKGTAYTDLDDAFREFH